MVADGNITVGGESFQFRFANTNDPNSDPEWESKLYFFFPYELCPVWSNAQWGEKSGCEPCNNKSSFPAEVTKTIGLLGMPAMQGHPHNTNLPAEHKSWKHLFEMKQLIHLHSTTVSVVSKRQRSVLLWELEVQLNSGIPIDILNAAYSSRAEMISWSVNESINRKKINHQLLELIDYITLGFYGKRCSSFPNII